MNKYGLILMIVASMLVSCSEKSQKQTSQHSQASIQTYYTCSMHPQIHEDKPGKCPICNMNLTKVQMDMNEKGHDHSDGDHYTCPMHPEIQEDKPGTCPICNMNLIKKVVDSDEKDQTKSSITNEAGTVIANIKLQKSQLEHFKPAYFPVSTMMMQKKVRLLGTVLQSEEKESKIPARVDGRVEKVYVQSTGSFIKIGDPVVDLYSPILITAGEEYLIARKSFEKTNSKEFENMLAQSEERLKLWGIKKFQYEAWFAKGKVPTKITIYSPTAGIVRKYNASVGRYFKEGQNLFELSDLSDVWIEMDVYEHDAALVSIGQNVSLEFTALPGEIMEGEIDFVNPVLDTTSRTLKVRTTVSNENGVLKPGMIADATLTVKLEGQPLVIPRSAMIDTGKRKVVWVQKEESKFQAKEIHTGYESEGYVEVQHGLKEGEEVVMNGNFLLDAQAQLFGGYEDMKGQGSGGHNH
jgi:biotin carboxyl carrier protein